MGRDGEGDGSEPVAAASDALPSGADILNVLRSRLPDMARIDRKIAAAILAGPEAATRMTLAALAQHAGASQPSVIRFCPKLGCDGFADFRISLARATAFGAPYLHREIGPADSMSDIIGKVFASSVDTLQMIGSRLDPAVMERAASAVARARRIELLGTGLSSVAAIDAHQKFMRLGVPTGLHADGHLQRMSCATLNAEDVALAFSYTGQLRDFLRTCEIVVERGAALIAVTRSDTPLAALATETIAIDTLENTFLYAPMTTRIAHLAVIDVLATAVAMHAGEHGLATIRRVKRAMRDEWMVDPDPEADSRTANARKQNGAS